MYFYELIEKERNISNCIRREEFIKECIEEQVIKQKKDVKYFSCLVGESGSYESAVFYIKKYEKDLSIIHEEMKKFFN